MTWGQSTSPESPTTLGHAGLMTKATLVFGTIFIAYDVFAYHRLWRQGYAISWQKVALLTSTAICSLWAWGFNTFGTAFMIMHLFHAVQYYGLGGSPSATTSPAVGLADRTWGASATFAGVVLLTLVCGLCVLGLGTMDAVVQVGLVVSLMHYWYNGFLWTGAK